MLEPTREQPAVSRRVPPVPIWITSLLVIISVPSVLWALVSLPLSTARAVPAETLELLGGAPDSDRWFLMIGYPTCGDVCPAGLSALGRVVEARSAQGGAVPAVTFVSTGKERNPTAAQTLAQQVHRDLRGVHVPRKDLSKLSRTFGAAAAFPAGPASGHAKSIYLLERSESGWSLATVFPANPPDPDRMLAYLENAQ